MPPYKKILKSMATYGGTKEYIESRVRGGFAPNYYVTDVTLGGAPNYTLTIEQTGTSNHSVNLSGIASTSPLTTKGDIYVYGSGDARLPAGTNGYVLAADSTEALGLKWVASTSTNYYLDGLTSVSYTHLTLPTNREV